MPRCRIPQNEPFKNLPDEHFHIATSSSRARPHRASNRLAAVVTGAPTRRRSRRGRRGGGVSVNPHWSERREGGGRFALWLIRAIGLRLGRPVARALLYPITLYFFFRRGPERRASRAFLSRALGRAAGTWDVLHHIHCYAA